MPFSAAAQPNIAAAPSSAATSSKHASHSHHDPAESSDAETEPLPYDDDDDDHEEDAHADVMDLNDLAQHAAASAAAPIPDDVDAPGEPADVSMDSQLEPSQAEDLAHHDDDDDDADGEDALPASQITVNQDPNSNLSSPHKTGGFTGDEFSDESELTDEDDEQNHDEDGSSLSDDDLGGSDDEEEEEEEDEDEEDDDEEDANSKTHEDEAAEALAALTGGADGADDEGGAAAGLDALAALATAGEAHADHADDDQDEEDDEDVSDQEAEHGAASATPAGGAAKSGRLSQLRQELDGDDFSSDITPEPEDADAAGADDASDREDGGSPRENDLDLIASMKKRAAATGGATSLLEPEQLVDSLPGSASSSRAVTPLGDEDEDAEKADHAEAGDADVDAKAPQADAAEAEHLDTAAGTPVPDAAEHDDDTSTDEAAIRRQEAMEALTKIEIGFAMLRDRLYVERLQEISKEGEMILDGTHPELLHLTKAIETRRQRRTELVEFWFEHQEKQYERVAKAEEFAAWSIWRSSCASLRRDMMDEFSRKRRRLDREKRTLDAPRPARRHQIFETELVRTPDRLHIPLEPPSQAGDADRAQANGSKAGRKQSAKRKALAREIDAADEYVAYPDLKGLAEADVMMDIEQMGIRPAGVPPGMYDPFYGAPMGLEFQNPEIYAMYGPEAAAAAAAAAAQAHMNGMPYGLPPGARGMPPPPPGAMMAPGTPGSVHHRHGMHPLPPPPGHMHAGMEMGMMGFDPYAAAEMEHAARMHHREQQARMGMDPNDPHHRSSPFPPDMYPGYPPHFNMPPGAGGPGGPGMNVGAGRGPGMGKMPPSPTPPHRGSSGGRKERASVEDGVHVSGRGRGAAKTSGRSKQARSSHAATSPVHGKPPSGGKTNLPPPPSMSSGAVDAVDEREHKAIGNGAAAGGHRSAAAPGAHHSMKQSAPFAGARSGPPLATPVAAAAAAGAGNRSLYPPE
ncbi:conserved hypothetical protein [Sporisorium reilianum SRZ2]|uniref:Uncharacterized protein n=1 Tax=Sporisorium reilianum (strain SRZ2) TaxID=999809 RepID=E6ZSF2_SPORE|nr:conserved hypothetical protein [Sporisorium reilianum SRZ2]